MASAAAGAHHLERDELTARIAAFEQPIGEDLARTVVERVGERADWAPT